MPGWPSQRLRGQQPEKFDTDNVCSSCHTLYAPPNHRDGDHGSEGVGNWGQVPPNAITGDGFSFPPPRDAAQARLTRLALFLPIQRPRYRTQILEHLEIDHYWRAAHRLP